MKTVRTRGWTRTIAGAMSLVALIFALAVGARPARADEAQDARHLVEKARLSLQDFLADSQMGPPLRNIMRRARGVLIYPQALRAAFIFGAAGASGVFLARDAQSDTWSGPAFYSFGQASFGLQAGADASEVVIVALTDRGVNALLSPSAKLLTLAKRMVRGPAHNDP